MFQIKLAERVIRICNHYSYVKNLCSGYVVSDTLPFELKIEISRERLLREQKNGEKSVSLPYCESICIYREIALKLLEFQTMVLHGAVISCKGRGIAFLAKSGVGKSTHIALWKRLLGDDVTVINGDKPLISYKKEKDKFVAYGTPWCGKEGWGCNASVVLDKLCFLVRGEKNVIRPMASSEVILKLFHQLLVPEEEKLLALEMNLIEKLLEKVPCFELSCNMETEAAETAYHALIGLTGKEELS